MRVSNLTEATSGGAPTSQIAESVASAAQPAVVAAPTDSFEPKEETEQMKQMRKQLAMYNAQKEVDETSRNIQLQAALEQAMHNCALAIIQRI